MKKNNRNESSRRRFLSLGLLGGAALFTTTATSQEPMTTNGETVPMLTPDGDLVEVPKSLLEKSSNRTKARNQDILNWTNVVLNNNKHK